jgi:hypothetical protein
LTLADERRSRRFRSQGIDPLMFRVFLALVGTLFLVVVGIGFSHDTGDLRGWGWLVLASFILAGAGLILASVFSSNKTAEKWSDAWSSHEATALLILVAFPIAWAIRKVFPSDAT